MQLLLVISIAAVTVALVTPEVQWASSGDIVVPVRVLAFDAATASPIVGARVRIVSAPVYPESLDEYRDRFPEDFFDRVKPGARHRTGPDGSVVINHHFPTGASNRNPEPRADMGWAWVMVLAEGYGRVAVPVRHESMPTKVLRERKELLVPIGLFRVKK